MSDDEGHGHTPQVRETSGPMDEAGRLSSQLYDLMALKGRTTGPGPILDVCGEEGADTHADTHYKVRHSWSVYGRSDRSLKAAWERLKDGLPEHGWKITDRGTESDARRTPYLLADARGKRFTVRITRELVPEGRTPAKGEESGILFQLVSDCFRVPEGETVR